MRLLGGSLEGADGPVVQRLDSLLHRRLLRGGRHQREGGVGEAAGQRLEEVEIAQIGHGEQRPRVLGQPPPLADRAEDGARLLELGRLVLDEEGADAAEGGVVRGEGLLERGGVALSQARAREHRLQRGAQPLEREPEQFAKLAADAAPPRGLEVLQHAAEGEVLEQLEKPVLARAVQHERAAELHCREVLRHGAEDRGAVFRRRAGR